MSHTSLRLTTAAVLSCLASIALAAPDGATTSGDTNKADECLAAPKGTTPPGGHWYYRLERGTKRKCWYLGDAGAKVKSAAKPAATASHETKATSQATSHEPPIQPKVANARAELAAPTASASEWPTEADAQLPARRAPQALASAAPDTTRETIAPNSQRQELAQAATSSIPDSNAPTNNASSGSSTDAAPADPQPQAQPVTTQPAATPPVHVRTAVVRPVPAQQPAAQQPVTPQATASTFSPFRIALGLLVVVIALAAFMNRHLLQRLGRRYFGLQAKRPQPRQRRDIWAPLEPDAERTTYEDMVAEPVELTEPPRWVRNVRELAEAREHVERLHAQAQDHERAYHDDLHQTDAGTAQAHDEPAEPRRSADELEDLLRRASQRPAPRRDAALPRETATPRVASAARVRTSTGRSGARA
jgi:hypothetical protein